MTLFSCIGISIGVVIEEVVVGTSGSEALLDGTNGEVILDVSRGSEALTCRLGCGVGSPSVSGAGEENSAAIGVSSAMDATAGCSGFSFGSSNVNGWGRGSVEDVGGYEGGPRGAILVYTAESQSENPGRRCING